MLQVENLDIRENQNNEIMKLGEIYAPIAREMVLVEMELSKQTKTDNKFVDEVISHFFKVPGKRLRPALLLLSAKAVNPQLSEAVNSKLIMLSTIVELIHSASLIHDDIIDSDSERRKQTSLNKQFGSHIAVLSGDILYSRAFTLLTDKFDKKILRILSQCVEKMCQGEINGLKCRGGLARPENRANKFAPTKEYLKIIGDKTASFMSACCQCGAILSHSTDKVLFALRNFGHNFGISYQIMDDYVDGDPTFTLKIDMFEKAKEYATQSKEDISFFDNSKYKENLQNLVEYVIERNSVSSLISFKNIHSNSRNKAIIYKEGRTYG